MLPVNPTDREIATMEITETTTESPVCPHCEKRLKEIYWHKVQGKGMSGVGYVAVYSCPHCKKVLSTSASQH